MPLSDPSVAGFVVQVPDPNAEVWFQDYKTKQRGNVREFESSALQPGQTYTFQVRARWMQNGRAVEQTQSVQTQPGQHANVVFRPAARETVPAPQGGK
jgi:uncharacterized protein (TIGR03000 family)